MATLYANKNFKLPKLVLTPPEYPSTYKDYNSAYLKENNFINNDNNSVISSYRVTPGWQMTIFTGDFNKGDSDIRTGYRKYLDGNFLNNIRSIRISKTLVSNEHFLLDTDNNNYLLLLLLIICLFFACRNKY